MNNVDSLMNLMIFATGIYAIYVAIIMIVKGEIPKGFLGQNVDINKCRDIEGFKNYISLKTLILGIIVVLYSILGFINTYVIEINKNYLIGGVIALGIVYVIFIVLYLRGRKRYLD